MEIAVRKVSDVQVIQLHGALRIGQAVDDLRGLIEPAVQKGDNRIVLNLEDVRMIDSSGIGLLVRFLALTKEKGGSLKLVRPSKFAIQTLRLVCVHHLFEIFEDDDQAVQSFS